MFDLTRRRVRHAAWRRGGPRGRSLRGAQEREKVRRIGVMASLAADDPRCADPQRSVPTRPCSRPAGTSGATSASNIVGLG